MMQDTPQSEVLASFVQFDNKYFYQALSSEGQRLSNSDKKVMKWRKQW